MSEEMASKLALPHVTLVAVTSVNLDATAAAIRASVANIDFGAMKLFSDKKPADLPSQCEWIRIEPLQSAQAYSHFILSRLAGHVATSHALVVQWDGYPLRARGWRDEFLEYDYVGASWPQFHDGFDVGNGGFSLRSRALIEACADPAFVPSHPEDLAIGRENRPWLEQRDFRFAPRNLADAFSSERTGDVTSSFGFHGVWHMPQVLGPNAFFDLYRTLDERGSLRHDYKILLRQIARGQGGLGRAVAFLCDRLIGFEKTGPTR